MGARGRRAGEGRASALGCACVALLLALLPACAATADGPGSDCGPPRGKVVEITDGDTIVLETGEKVRYLLVDTPESTGGNVECYGAEARAYNTSLVLGKTVTLAYDEECEDDYQRLLAYVTVDGRDVNRLLLERGFGCVLFIPPNGAGRRDDFEAVEAEAKAGDRGLWGACTPRPCG